MTQWPTDWKKSIYIAIAKTGDLTEYANDHIITLFSHVSKITPRVIQYRLEPYVQGGVRKGQKTRDIIADELWIMRKPKNIKKNSIFEKRPLIVLIVSNLGICLECCPHAKSIYYSGSHSMDRI